MFWIEGIAHTPSGFALNTLLADGSRMQRPLADLSLPPFTGKTVRKRITTDCATWTFHSAEPFWQHMGLQTYQPTEGHAVFQVIDQDKRYLIPASVLIAAMMRPIKYMQSYLFRPQGLDAFSLPIIDTGHPSIGLHQSQWTVFGSTKQLPKGLLASYSWMHCFPTARAMWDSVYLGSLAGRLTLALPQASVTISLHSVKCQGYYLVTEAVIMSLDANEQPFAFANGHASNILFHDSASIDWAVRHNPTCTIPARGKEWKLSDDEWREISAMLSPGRRAKYDLRNIIDLILIKFGTGQAWRKLNFGVLNFPIVQHTYQQMQKNGRWATVEGLLQESRRISVT